MTSEHARDRKPVYHDTDQPYVLPKDQKEQDRLRNQHAAIKSMLQGGAFTAKVAFPRIIVDLGCGTGAVTEELANAYPDADAVYGVDISPVEVNPSRGRNITFIQGDIHSLVDKDSRLAPGTADFVFSRLLIYAIPDWSAYLRRIFSLLKPGGVVEMQDFCDQFFVDRSPAASESILPGWDWLHLYRTGAAQKGMDLDCGMKLEMWMRQVGFVEVVAQEYKVPYYYDENEPHLRGISEVHIGDPYGMFWHAFPKLVDGLGLSKDHVQKMREQMLEKLAEENGKYQTYHVVTGKKPEVEDKK